MFQVSSRSVSCEDRAKSADDGQDSRFAHGPYGLYLDDDGDSIVSICTDGSIPGFALGTDEFSVLQR